MPYAGNNEVMLMNVAIQKVQEKERTRGPNLAVFVRFKDGVSTETVLSKAEDAGVVLASNLRLSKALVQSEEWKSHEEAFTCRSGTIIAYTEPGKKLGKEIEYSDPQTSFRHIFPVPEEHQGKKNAVLVAEHPDYAIEIDGKNRIFRFTQVDLIEGFPASDGWYMGDTAHDLPSGDMVERMNLAARHLWRTGTWIGLISRNCGRLISMTGPPSSSFGAVVEAPDGNPLSMDGIAKPKAVQQP